MLTVSLFADSVHQQPVSVLAESVVATAPPPDVLSAFAIIVVIMLLGFALEGVKPVVVIVLDLVRTLFNALGVAALLVLALIVLIGVLVVSAAGH